MTKKYFTTDLKTEKILIKILNVCSYSPVNVLENEKNSFQRGNNHTQGGDAMVPVGRNRLMGELLGGFWYCARHPVCRGETKAMFSLIVLWVWVHACKCCRKGGEETFNFTLH